MSESRWYRQDAKESSRDWFLEMPVEARLAWRMLLDYVCEVQLSQKRPGVAPALSPRAASRRWDISTEGIEAMLRTVVELGFLAIANDEWHVLEPGRFQKESTERVRRKRAGDCNAQPVTTGENPAQPVTEPDNAPQPVTPVARQSQPQGQLPSGVSGETPGASRAGRWDPLRDPLPSDPPGDEGDPFERVAWTLRSVNEALGWSSVTRTDVTRSLSESSPVRELIAAFGEREAAGIFLTANAVWSSDKPPTWKAVHAQRDTLRARMRRLDSEASSLSPQPQPEGRNFAARPSPRDLAAATLALIEEGARVVS